MIVKIQPKTEDIFNALNYNTRKATGEDGIHDEKTILLDEENNEKGHLVMEKNVPQLSTLKNEFGKLLMKNQRIKGKPLKETCFHASINPGENDKPLTEEDIVRLAEEIMEKMGYGDVPYALFKHTDTGRTHYHIVASRIGQDGKKINDSFENRRINKICEALGKKYGFTMGNPESIQAENISQSEDTTVQETPIQDNVKSAVLEPRKDKDEQSPVDEEKVRQNEKEKAKNKETINAFLLSNKMPLKEQFKCFHEEAMKWHFTTPEQYQAIMEHRFNVIVEEYDDGLHFYGKADGEKVTLPLTESEIGIHAIRDILKECKDEKMSVRASQKKRINELTQWAADNTKTWKGFRDLMYKKGVIVVLHWSEKNELFGVTYLDRATRCAWKASELTVNLAWLKKTANEKGWKIHKDIKKVVQKNEEPTGLPSSEKVTAQQKKNTVGISMKQDKEMTVQKTESPSLMQRTTDALERIKHTGKHSRAKNNKKDDIYIDEAERIMNWKAM